MSELIAVAVIVAFLALALLMRKYNQSAVMERERKDS